MADFRPSTDGFAFGNDWPSEPALLLSTPFGRLAAGDAGRGLCGGMVFAALDYWHAVETPPIQRPRRGDELYSFIVRRLISSWQLPVGVARYYHGMARAGAARRTVDRELPAVLDELDRGCPSPLGLVTVASARPADLVLNHQVLACAYSVAGSEVTLSVYDPNRGPSDDAAIRIDTDAPDGAAALTHTLGIDRPVRSLFRTRYRWARPPD